MAIEATLDPISMLEADHRRAEELFETIQNAEGDERTELVEQLMTELLVHMQLEETHVYPLVDREVDHEKAEEAEAEHSLAREVMAHLSELAPDGPGFDGALDMVKAGIEHHVQEEEGDILPKLRDQLSSEELTQLGQTLSDARNDLMGAGSAELQKRSNGRSTKASGRKGGGKSDGAKSGKSGKSAGDGAKEPTKAELVEQAKKKGVSGYSNMKKDELVSALADA